MNSISILCPNVELGNPKTGGHVYDFRFFDVIQEMKLDPVFFDDRALGRKQNETLKKLPIRILSNLKKLASNNIIIFNTSLFAYYILPFFLLKLLYPRLRLIGIHHHFRFQEHQGFKRKLYKFLEFTNLKQCYTVINPCPYTRDVLLQNWKNGRVVTLENSFDSEPKEMSSHKKYKFLYVGTVYQRKGIMYLLEAINLIPAAQRDSITVDIVGSLNETSLYVKNLRKYISDNHLEGIINLRGRVSDKELQNYYSNAYAFILPSLLEGYGLVIIEAMSYGLPVIAFNNSAMPYTIKHESNGLLADNKNSESLKDNILRLIHDQTLYNKLSENAHSFSKNVYSTKEFKKDAAKLINSW